MDTRNDATLRYATLRQRFADERTASMEEEDYVNTFFEFRKAFFMSARGGGHKAKAAKARGKSCPGSKAFLVRERGGRVRPLGHQRR